MFSTAGFYFSSKNTLSILLFCLLALSPAILFSQEKTIDKANTAYKYKQYAAAAKMYEEVIAEKEASDKKSGLLTLQTKLAYCYRMNNKTEAAEALYAKLVQNEKAKHETYLFYGEALMSNGKYDEAKKWFLDYQTIEPEDGRGALMAANCDRVKSIEPYFAHVDIRPFAYNSDADDNAPVGWQNGLVFSSDRKQGTKLMKEKSGWTGRDYLDLYCSAINADSIYEAPKRFSAKLSEVNKNTGNASFTADGKEVYFTRNDNELNKKQTYDLQLFRAINNGNNKWRKTEKLSFCSPNTTYMHPAVSPDGSELFFTTDRKGEGGTDIWVSKRKGDDWGRPVNLGPTINTSANEGFPFIDKNGRLYFCSKGHPTYGGFDIFFSERDESGNWQTPRNLGKPINSSLDDISIYVYPDGKTGMLSSSREGGDDDIYFFVASDEAPLTEVTNQSPPLVNQKPRKEPLSEKQTLPFETIAKTEKVNVSPQEKETIDTPPTAIIEKKQPSISIAKPATPPSDKDILKEKQTPAAPMEQPVISKKINNDFEKTEQPLSFQQLMERAKTNGLASGETYKIDGAVFDPNVWQLTPRVAKRLKEIVNILRKYPKMEIEINAHTESLGEAEHNLALSQNRADMAIEYMLRAGIDKKRIKGTGHGEAQPLNHCSDGVTCSTEEHLFNQRLEVKIKL